MDRLVDKANLLGKASTVALGTGTGTGAAVQGSLERTQTVDVCFGTMGVFEITSLGRVWGKDGPAPTGSTTWGPPMAQSILRSVVRVMDHVTHNCQRDFESNADLFNQQTGNRVAVRTYPNDDIFQVKDLSIDKLGSRIQRADKEDYQPLNVAGWVALDRPPKRAGRKPGRGLVDSSLIKNLGKPRSAWLFDLAAEGNPNLLSLGPDHRGQGLSPHLPDPLRQPGQARGPGAEAHFEQPLSR